MANLQETCEKLALLQDVVVQCCGTQAGVIDDRFYADRGKDAESIDELTNREFIGLGCMVSPHAK